MNINDDLSNIIHLNVKQALSEDIGSGDISESLSSTQIGHAKIVAREQAILCGQPWFDEVFQQLDSGICIDWRINEGEAIQTDDIICTLSGNAAKLLTGERSGLNFIQLLSATASKTHYYSGLIQATRCQVLDTRKTLPGLRCAQKYAVRIGGGGNHRMGLFDAILIKENHIKAAKGINSAVLRAKTSQPKAFIEIEVENLEEYFMAQNCAVDRIMLDNFNLQDIKYAVQNNTHGIKLEASGGITALNILDIANTGVDYISLGTLTKDIKAIDFSMLFTD